MAWEFLDKQHWILHQVVAKPRSIFSKEQLVAIATQGIEEYQRHQDVDRLESFLQEKAKTIDPENDKPYRVKVTEQEMVIYSLGSNGRDDGGKFNLYDDNRGDEKLDDVALKIKLSNLSNKN